MIPANHPLAGRLHKPDTSVRVTLYGADGIGKTTFGVEAPDPIVLATERSRALNKVPSVFPQSWEDVFKIVHELIRDPFGRKTFVVDTVDFLYPMSVNYVCRRDQPQARKPLMMADGRPLLENYGYGQGPKVVAQEWSYFLASLDELSLRHGMYIILLAHAGRHKVNNPSGENYEVLGPKVDKDTADLLCHWPDTVLYAEFYRTPVATEERDGKRAKMTTDGRRVCWTQERQAHRAKNRDGMPEVIPFGWNEFARYALADLDALEAQIHAKLEKMRDDEMTQKTEAYLRSVRREAGPLLRVLERLNDKGAT